MNRFPSLRSVLYCCAAATAIALAIPVNPASSIHQRAVDRPSYGAVPAMSSAVQPVVNGGLANNSTPATPGQPGAAQQPGTPQQPGTANGTQNATANEPIGPESWGYTNRKTSKLRIRVIDGRTHAPLPGAEVVLIETEQRFTTDSNGYTPWFDAPIFRNPKYRPMVAELHGQLGVIAYKLSLIHI